MSYRLEFEIHGLPRTTNGNVSIHWRAKHKESRIWKTRVESQVILNGRPPEPLLKAKLHLERHSSSEPDFDGLVSSFKFVIDALIDARVLIDDRMTNIGQPAYSWVMVPRNKGKIKIIIEEIS
jgi:hypothetical protein